MARKVTLHQSTVRPTLLAGAERDLVWVNVILGMVLIFGVGSMPSAITGVVSTVLIHQLLIRLAKWDPQFFDVYRRHIHYQDFYPARAHYCAPSPLVKY